MYLHPDIVPRWAENTTQGCGLRVAGGGWSLNPLATVSEIHADDSTNKPPRPSVQTLEISRGAHGLGGFPNARRECERQRDPAPTHGTPGQGQDQG